MACQPGDSFDVFCQNKASEVDSMLHRLGLQDQKNYHVHVSLKKDTKKKGSVQLSYNLPCGFNVLSKRT